MRRKWLRIVVVFVSGVCSTLARADEPAARPDHFVLNYPAAEQFSPPVASYFDDVTTAIQKVGGRTVHHQLNGGYSLPVVDTVDGKHLLHLGADVSWYRAGQPVYAIAAGVVRLSQGSRPIEAAQDHQRKNGDSKSSNPDAAVADIPDLASKGGDLSLPNNGQPDDTHGPENPGPGGAKPAPDRAMAEPPKKPPGNGIAPRAQPAMGWGNLIVIEHRLNDGTFVTSIYGHLGAKRLVSVGDVVQAGQMIGTVGKAGQENGGFKAHLHIGLREGRMYEPGCLLFTMTVNAKPATIIVGDLNEAEVELRSETTLPTPIELPISDHRFTITSRDGKLWIPAAALNYIRRSDYPITGYALSSKGWRDPTEFLLQMLDKFPRAPFRGLSPQQRQR